MPPPQHEKGHDTLSPNASCPIELLIDFQNVGQGPRSRQRMLFIQLFTLLSTTAATAVLAAFSMASE